MSLTFKDYRINHIALLFIKVLTLSKKQVKIQNSMSSISPTFSRLIKKIKKFITKVLPCSIDSQSVFDRSKSTFNWLKRIIDRLRQWRISSWIFCLTRLIPIPLRSIEKYIQSIERNSRSIEICKNWIFSEFC